MKASFLRQWIQEANLSEWSSAFATTPPVNVCLFFTSNKKEVNQKTEIKKFYVSQIRPSVRVRVSLFLINYVTQGVCKWAWGVYKKPLIEQSDWSAIITSHGRIMIFNFIKYVAYQIVWLLNNKWECIQCIFSMSYFVSGITKNINFVLIIQTTSHLQTISLQQWCAISSNSPGHNLGIYWRATVYTIIL